MFLITAHASVAYAQPGALSHPPKLLLGCHCSIRELFIMHRETIFYDRSLLDKQRDPPGFPVKLTPDSTLVVLAKPVSGPEKDTLILVTE